MQWPPSFCGQRAVAMSQLLPVIQPLVVSQPLAASQLLPVSQPAMHQPLQRQTRHHTKVLAVRQPGVGSQSLRGIKNIQSRMLQFSANPESGGI